MAAELNFTLNNPNALSRITNISGFTRIKKIVEGGKFIICSAIRRSDALEVILKILRFDHPDTDVIAMLFHEYEVGKDLNNPSIIRFYDLLDQENLYALVLENIHGVSLREYLKSHPPRDLSSFLQLFIQMTQAVGEVHKNHIIHKDIKPDNFIVAENASVLKITDFNCASKLSHEIQDAVPPGKLEGTLAYMAPEQTGRMNMQVDYRSDFYALGVTFYEMLTGQLPFYSPDPLEMLHAHLTHPVPPMHNPDFPIPEMLTRIVHKLMAKNSAERYQSTIGLQTELEECLSQLNETGHIDLFPTGQHDVFDRLNLSQKLYGREEEVKVLLEAYERVSHGSVEMFLVSGYSGVGKTMLINEVHKGMVKQNGYFISGKFDQLQHNMPYTAFTQAFNQLIRLILMRPEEEFLMLKQEIMAALGSVAQIIIDLIPDLALITGPQPPVLQLSPAAQLSRLINKFNAFLHVIATEKHPLVIFIDDLQWIDSASLQLIEKIMDDHELKHFLLIGAYRDNEVDVSHPLNYLFKKMEEKNAPVVSINLAPLAPCRFEELLKDSFHRDAASTKMLADFIYKRTDGNPFFCKQLVKTLYQKHLLYFDYAQRRWEWNLDRISSMEITDNVVYFMLHKIDELPAETLTLLKYAACIGNRFTLATLGLVAGKTAAEVGKDLWPALEGELIVGTNQDYKYIDAMRDANLERLLASDIAFQFIHDRVQQAVYQSLPLSEKQTTHLTIARLLLEMEPKACQKERLYEVTDHLNHAHDLLSPEEKMQAMLLNYEAGRRAESANAYSAMHHYLQASLSLIDDGFWESNYALMFKLKLAYVKSLYFTAHIHEATKLAQELEAHANNAVDKAGIYRLQYLTFFAQGNAPAAMKAALQSLKLVGVEMPMYPSRFQIYAKLFQVKMAMRRHNIENLEQELEPLEDTRILYAFQMIYDLVLIAPWFPGDFWVYLCLISTELMLKYGRPPGYQLCTCIYSGIMLLFTRNIKYVSFLVRDAEKPSWRSNDNYTDAITIMIVGYGFIHLIRPIKQSNTYLQLAIQKGVESGNIQSVGHCLFCMALTQLAISKSIKDTHDYAQKALKYCSTHSLTDRTALNQLICTICSGLRSQEVQLDDVKQSYEKMLQSKNYFDRLRSPLLTGWYFFFMEEYGAACECHFKWYPEEERLRYLPTTYTQKTIDALSIYKYKDKVPFFKRAKYALRFEKLCREVAWIAKQCPHNYLHQHLILTGMKAGGRRDFYAAIQAFEKAAENAKKGDFYLWVAIANELAGELFMQQNQIRFAKNYISEAHYYYNRYGMQAKVEAIEKRYPFITDERSSKVPHEYRSSSTSLSSSSSSLDFMSVIKASQTISGEIVLERLFERMLHIVVENAGADRALFLENNHKEWLVVAALEVQPEGVKFTKIDIPPDKYQDISMTIFKLAHRSKVPIIFNHASEEDQLSEDPHILRRQPKSILCLPVLHLDKIMGIIYLENNFTVDVFNQDRVSVLTTLAAQIAISLENSRYLYDMHQLYQKTERFVPKQFLKLLGKENISDVKLGDSIQLDLTAMFADIRNFTSLSEKLEPKRLTKLLNIYLGYMAPVIRDHRGFVEHFLGDGILALFPGSADEAVRAALRMQEAFIDFNAVIQAEGFDPIDMGIGLNHGPAMLTILGEPERLDANVVSDAINTASRVEGLNKFYKTGLLISDTVYDNLIIPEEFLISVVDSVRLKGKSRAQLVYQVIPMPADKEARDAAQQYIKEFESAFKAYDRGDFRVAVEQLNLCLTKNPHDHVAKILLARSEKSIDSNAPKDDAGSETVFDIER